MTRLPRAFAVPNDDVEMLRLRTDAEFVRSCLADDLLVRPVEHSLSVEWLHFDEWIAGNDFWISGFGETDESEASRWCPIRISLKRSRPFANPMAQFRDLMIGYFQFATTHTKPPGACGSFNFLEDYDGEI